MGKELIGSLELNRIYQMDCIEGSRLIADDSVDLILTDPPYGNMNTDGGRKLGINGWDTALEPTDVFSIADRTLRKNGKMILFSQEPYTTKLVNSAPSNIPFLYRAIWEKDSFANALGVNKAMVSMYEDILIFKKASPKVDYKKTNPLRKLLSKYVDRYGKEYIINLFLEEGRYSSQQSARVHASYKFAFNGGNRVDLMTRDLFDYLSKFIEFEESYEELSSAYHNHHDKVKQDLDDAFPSIFNLWEGRKYKSNILKYRKDYDGYHPTQKPLLLLEDLIKTFSNEGDTIVDLTIGSGSTAVAARRTHRNFIGFELEAEYIEIANQRLEAIQDTEADDILTKESE